MSLEIKVYMKEVSDDLIPQIVSRLNDFEMTCEIDPNFSFKDKTGFLPFKFRLLNSPFDVLKNKNLLSGFELYVSHFNFEEVIAELNEDFLDELSETPSFATLEIEEKLKDCRKELTFVWNIADSFEFRFASLTSAILTKLADGVCCYPADDIWYDNTKIVEDA